MQNRPTTQTAYSFLLPFNDHKMAMQRWIKSSISKKVILVDPNESDRLSYSMLIGSSSTFQIVAESKTAEECINILQRKRADIIISELELPGASGKELIQWIRMNKPWMDVIVLSLNSSEDAVFQALKAGAAGYLLKNTHHLELMRYLSEILKRGAPMSPQISRVVVESFHPKLTNEVLEKLEVRVVQLLASGISSKLIADQLSIPVDTLRKLIRKVYKKLNVKSKSNAIATAKAKKLL